MPAVHVPFHVVVASECFDISDAAEETAHLPQTAGELARWHVLQYIGAHDEIEAAGEAQGAQLTEGAQSNTAVGAACTDDVRARIDAGIREGAPHLLQDVIPRGFTTTHIEYAANPSTKEIFGGAHGEMHFALEYAHGADPRSRIVIPPAEIRSVVHLRLSRIGQEDRPHGQNFRSAPGAP